MVRIKGDRMTPEQERCYERAVARYPDINSAYQSLIIAKLEQELEELECKIRRIGSLVEQYESK